MTDVIFQKKWACITMTGSHSRHIIIRYNWTKLLKNLVFQLQKSQDGRQRKIENRPHKSTADSLKSSATRFTFIKAFNPTEPRFTSSPRTSERSPKSPKFSGKFRPIRIKISWRYSGAPNRLQTCFTWRIKFFDKTFGWRPKRLENYARGCEQ